MRTIAPFPSALQAFTLAEARSDMRWLAESLSPKLDGFDCGADVRDFVVAKIESVMASTKSSAAEVDNVIVKLNKVFGITMVVVTHDLPSAYAIADRIVVLFDGRVAALGERDAVWHDPDPRLRDFIERRLPAEDGEGMDVIHHIEV